MLFAKISPTKVMEFFFPFFGTPIVNGPSYKSSYTILKGLLNEKCDECAKVGKKEPLDLK